MLKSFLGVLLFVFCACCSSNHQESNAPTKTQSPSQKWMQNDGRIKVLSSTAMINDLVKQVGGQYVDSIALIQGELDPHSYELVKGDDEKLARADIIFFNGLGLEHGPSLKKYFSSHKQAIPLGDLIKQEDASLILHDKGEVDPHIWMDISLWQKNVPYITKALIEKDPEHARFYEEQAVALQEKMEDAHLQVKKLMSSIPESKRFLVTSHDAFNYFARSYLAGPLENEFSEWKKRFVAPEGLAPEGQMSVKDIKEIIAHMKQYGITVLFPESNVSKDSIKKIVDAGCQEGMKFEIAKDTLYGDAMGALGSEEGTYLGMILSNARVIEKYLNRGHEL